MLLLGVDVTNHLQVIFDFIYSVYRFLNSIEFTAFGFNFTLLGIFLALFFLIVLIKFMKFGFEEGARSEIKFRREENKSEQRNVQKGGSKWF